MKLALCFDRSAASEAYQNATDLCVLPFANLDMSVRMIDRAVCETDESTLQIIPYIMVLDQSTDKILCYSRGKGSDEARLQGNLSIGLGGHIDKTPADGQALMDLLQEEAARELQEEADIEVNKPISFSYLLCDPTNAVGRVHFGVLGGYSIPSTAVLTFEKDVIEHGQWLSLAELRAPGVYERLENWSRAVVDALKDDE